MMDNRLIEIIRRQSRPMMPVPTEQPPKLQPLDDIRAVLFDIYGTVFLSASGEVGTAARSGDADAIVTAAAACGLRLLEDPAHVIRSWRERIEAVHAQRRRQGIDWPEVNIVEIWREVLSAAAAHPFDDFTLHRFALEFELQVNPVWPAPHVLEVITALRRSRRLLGLISNAQFFTPLLFSALFGHTAEELGFVRELCVFSFEQGQAKPARGLFQAAATVLASRGIRAAQTLYIGNDVRNDILPAAEMGVRTALFAGDARSLRLRLDDPVVAACEPDLILDNWTALMECLGEAHG